MLVNMLLLGLFCFVFCGKTDRAKAAPNNIRKAIVVVSSGTSYPETIKAAIEAVEDKIRAEYPGFTIRRAFTSRAIINKLQRTENLFIDTPGEALAKLKAEGYAMILVQPLHIIAGREYEQLKQAVDAFAADNRLLKVILGKPVLSSAGEMPDSETDYVRAVKALTCQLPPLSGDEAVVLMGHGSRHPGNMAYAVLQQKFDEAGMPVYIGTVEATPTLADIMVRLRAGNIKRVILMPFMLVAGGHAQNDLAGDDDDSWKVQLQNAGYEVAVYMHGLGESPAYQNIYVRNVAAALNS